MNLVSVIWILPRDRATVGVALAPDHGATLSALMRAADIAMYHAKAEGRGRVEHFNDRLAAAQDDRVRLDQDLRRALERQQFMLVFQPQIIVHAAKVKGWEPNIIGKPRFNGVWLEG